MGCLRVWQARKEVGELQKAATLHTREAASLSLVRRRLSEAETQVERLRFENEVGLATGVWTVLSCRSLKWFE